MFQNPFKVDRFLKYFAKIFSMANSKNNNKNNQEPKGQQVQAANGQVGNSNTVKDPDDWTTGNEPMTGAQQSYLKTLSDEAGEPVEGELTKAEASKKIEELQQQTGRGLEENNR